VALAGHRKDLHPACYQDEHVRSRLAFDAHRRDGREHAHPAEGRQDRLFGIGQKTPEALGFWGRSHRAQIHITGNASRAG
jgi:hypothetical protein